MATLFQMLWKILLEQERTLGAVGTGDWSILTFLLMLTTTSQLDQQRTTYGAIITISFK